MIIAAGVVGTSMGFIDGTVVPLAMPAIRQSLGATLTDATWINNAYMLTLAALILSGGALGDRFGLGRVFAIGVGMFMAASLASALAPSPKLLIAARLVQGAGAALMIPGSLAMISRAYPREDRSRAIGIWAAGSAMTTAVGPIIAGLALSVWGPDMWRWVFAINLPLGIFALTMIWRGVAQDARKAGQPVDLVGGGLAIIGLGSLAWMLTHLEGPATTPLTWATGGLGLTALLAFLYQEWRTRVPMMPLSLFADGTFSAANAVTFALYFSMSAILFFLPMLTVAGWGVSEIEAAVAFAPLSIFVFLFSTRFGRLADRIGPGWVIALGALIVALGYGVLARVAPSQAYWTAIVPAMTITGFGMSMVVAPLSSAVMGAVYDSQSGIASGINNAISRIAGLIAVAAMGSVASFHYARAGGPLSYGETASHPDHIDAMAAALSAIAWSATGLSLAAALVAILGIRRPRHDSAP